MNAPAIVHLAPLLAMLVWASVTDLRERKIRNWLTLTLLVTGLMQSFTPIRTVSPANASLGFLAGFGITFILFALGALGGGDVKLLAGVGAWIGPMGAIAVFLVAALIGMVIVLAQATWQGRITVLLRNSALVAVNLIHVREVGVEHLAATGRSSRSVDRPLPYAVPILLAVAALVIKSYVIA